LHFHPGIPSCWDASRIPISPTELRLGWIADWGGTVFLLGVFNLIGSVLLMILWNLKEPSFFLGDTLPEESASGQERLNSLSSKSL